MAQGKRDFIVYFLITYMKKLVFLLKNKRIKKQIRHYQLIPESFNLLINWRNIRLVLIGV